MYVYPLKGKFNPKNCTKRPENALFGVSAGFSDGAGLPTLCETTEEGMIENICIRFYSIFHANCVVLCWEDFILQVLKSPEAMQSGVSMGDKCMTFLSSIALFSCT